MFEGGEPFARGISMYFIYLQLRFISDLCSYCLISAVVSVLLVFAAVQEARCGLGDEETLSG